jgi:hypothetical protein
MYADVSLPPQYRTCWARGERRQRPASRRRRGAVVLWTAKRGSRLAQFQNLRGHGHEAGKTFGQPRHSAHDVVTSPVMHDVLAPRRSVRTPLCPVRHSSGLDMKGAVHATHHRSHRLPNAENRHPFAEDRHNVQLRDHWAEMLYLSSDRAGAFDLDAGRPGPE